MITTTYDREADALYIRLAPKTTAIEETREVADNVRLDYDASGRLVGIEVLEVEAAQALNTAANVHAA
jgi:YD repeat-containing protein